MKFKDQILHKLDIVFSNDIQYYAFQANLKHITEDIDEKLDVDQLLSEVILPAVRSRFDKDYYPDITKLVDFRVSSMNQRTGASSEDVDSSYEKVIFILWRV